MSNLTDRLYAAWLASNGSTRSPIRLNQQPRSKSFYTSPVWKLAPGSPLLPCPDRVEDKYE